MKSRLIKSSGGGNSKPHWTSRWVSFLIISGKQNHGNHLPYTLPSPPKKKSKRCNSLPGGLELGVWWWSKSIKANSRISCQKYTKKCTFVEIDQIKMDTIQWWDERCQNMSCILYIFYIVTPLKHGRLLKCQGCPISRIYLWFLLSNHTLQSRVS